MKITDTETETRWCTHWNIKFCHNINWNFFPFVWRPPDYDHSIPDSIKACMSTTFIVCPKILGKDVGSLVTLRKRNFTVHLISICCTITNFIMPSLIVVERWENSQQLLMKITWPLTKFLHTFLYCICSWDNLDMFHLKLPHDICNPEKVNKMSSLN